MKNSITLPVSGEDYILGVLSRKQAKAYLAKEKEVTTALEAGEITGQTASDRIIESLMATAYPGGDFESMANLDFLKLHHATVMYNFRLEEAEKNFLGSGEPVSTPA